ncbi:MAG: S8 family serine peptidase [Pseudomonadota bacterium]
MTKMRSLFVGFAWLYLVGVQPASAQSRAHMRHMSTDRIVHMHHMAQMMHARHQHSDMMIGAKSRYATASMAGMERLSSNQGRLLVKSGEVIGIDLTPASRSRLAELGYSVKAKNALDTLGMTLDVIEVPTNRSVKAALKRLKKKDPIGTYVANPIFMPSSDLRGRPKVLEQNVSPYSTSLESTPIPGFANEGDKDPHTDADRSLSRQSSRIGIVDTGADETSLRSDCAKPYATTRSSATIRQRKFGPGERPLARQHGTTVAEQALRSGACYLVIADVYSNKTGYADATAIARSLEWMANEKVTVINLSLTGPPNPILKRSVGAILKRGHTIVAAVGNDGEKNGAAFPAAYPGVIGVTAISNDLTVYHKANTGPGVDFAAIGVDIPVAENTIDGSTSLSGTSFAAPVVSAMLGEHFSETPNQASGAAVRYLERLAVDLGPPGRDTVYGVGAVFPRNDRRASTLRPRSFADASTDPSEQNAR